MSSNAVQGALALAIAGVGFLAIADMGAYRLRRVVYDTYCGIGVALLICAASLLIFHAILAGLSRL